MYEPLIALTNVWFPKTEWEFTIGILKRISDYENDAYGVEYSYFYPFTIKISDKDSTNDILLSILDWESRIFDKIDDDLSDSEVFSIEYNFRQLVELIRDIYNGVELRSITGLYADGISLDVTNNDGEKKALEFSAELNMFNNKTYHLYIISALHNFPVAVFETEESDNPDDHVTPLGIDSAFGQLIEQNYSKKESDSILSESSPSLIRMHEIFRDTCNQMILASTQDRLDGCHVAISDMRIVPVANTSFNEFKMYMDVCYINADTRRSQNITNIEVPYLLTEKIKSEFEQKFAFDSVLAKEFIDSVTDTLCESDEYSDIPGEELDFSRIKDAFGYLYITKISEFKLLRDILFPEKVTDKYYQELLNEERRLLGKKVELANIRDLSTYIDHHEVKLGSHNDADYIIRLKLREVHSTKNFYNFSISTEMNMEDFIDGRSSAIWDTINSFRSGLDQINHKKKSLSGNDDYNLVRDVIESSEYEREYGDENGDL